MTKSNDASGPRSQGQEVGYSVVLTNGSGEDDAGDTIVYDYDVINDGTVTVDDRDAAFASLAGVLGVNTGLGLSISRQIVDDHGGSIRLQSAADESALFAGSTPIEPGAIDIRVVVTAVYEVG